MTALTRYIEAWLANDPELSASAVAVDSTITECSGPLSRGRTQVRAWAEQRIAAGGIVHSQSITDHIVIGDRDAAQWVFECTWNGVRSSFDGATIARSADEVIAELREYQTTAPLYEWTGTRP